VSRGLQASPVKVTVTASGQLDADADFFLSGEVEKVVYCGTAGLPEARQRLGSVATVVDGGHSVDLRRVSEALYGRGVRTLMVEGGQRVLTQFLVGDLADELQLVVAPLFVGDPGGRRLVHDGRFPWRADRRATLAEVRQLGDVVLLQYALSSRFRAEPEV
jgi:5-amino-6-(5-phosphoribosylamino)uracil reductase